MTNNGGFSSGSGTIFSLDPASSTFNSLKEFDYTTEGGFPYGGLMQASDGKLYGEGLFSFDPSNSTYTHLAYGGDDNGSLIQASDGKLYGMTSNGGNTNTGTIFSYDIHTSIHT